MLETALTADYSLVKCEKADTLGNLQFNKTTRNFNPDMARAGRITIAEAEEIVEPGELDPENIHCAGIYVDRVVQGINEQHRIEKVTLKTDGGRVNISAKNEKLRQQRIKIARRAAAELKDGMFANLGIGMPTTTANFIDPNANVFLHSENGMLGIGPYPEPGDEDSDLINAGKETVTLKTGGCFLNSTEAFSIIRGNHLDLTMLGAFQVSTNGDVANWTIPGKLLKGMGGAMDLISNVKKVFILMSLVDKHGKCKIVNSLDLPATGVGKVNKVITEYGVFKFLRPKDSGYFDTIHKSNMVMTEISRDTSKAEIEKIMAGIDFSFADDLKIMEDNSSQHQPDMDEWEEILNFFN